MPSFHWLLPQEVDLPSCHILHRPLLTELHRAYPYIRILVDWGDVSAHGRQVRRDISSSHKSVRRVNQRLCYYWADNIVWIQNMQRHGLELWPVLDHLHLGLLVHEEVGRVRRLIFVILEAAVLTQVLRRHEWEPLQIYHFHAVRWYSLSQL